MHSPLLLPITLTTACILALFYLFLSIRVVRGRRHYRVSLGDGDNEDLRVRVRVHANFGEYVPLMLILMGLLETSNANPLALMIVAVLIIAVRVLHVLGIPRRGANGFRVGGAGGTFLLLAVLAIWGLVLVLTA